MSGGSAAGRLGRVPNRGSFWDRCQCLRGAGSIRLAWSAICVVLEILRTFIVLSLVVRSWFCAVSRSAVVEAGRKNASVRDRLYFLTVCVLTPIRSAIALYDNPFPAFGGGAPPRSVRCRPLSTRSKFSLGCVKRPSCHPLTIDFRHVQ